MLPAGAGWKTLEGCCRTPACQTEQPLVNTFPCCMYCMWAISHACLHPHTWWQVLTNSIGECYCLHLSYAALVERKGQVNAAFLKRLKVPTSMYFRYVILAYCFASRWYIVNLSESDSSCRSAAALCDQVDLVSPQIKITDTVNAIWCASVWLCFRTSVKLQSNITEIKVSCTVSWAHAARPITCVRVPEAFCQQSNVVTKILVESARIS